MLRSSPLPAHLTALAVSILLLPTDLAAAPPAGDVTAPASASTSASARTGHASSGYERGFFLRSDDGKHALALNLRMQSRFAHTALADARDRSAFQIARALLMLRGHVYDEALRFRVEFDFGRGGVPNLKDFYVDHALRRALVLRVGQWKRPFSRQQMNSSGRFELVDRAITDAAFNASLDLGIGLHNDCEASPVWEWWLGVFNGTNELPWFVGQGEMAPDGALAIASSSRFSNVPDMFHPAAVARIAYNAGGIRGYSEADLEGGPLRYAVGASGLADFDADDSDDGSLMAELDYIVKIHGFSTTGALYVASRQRGEAYEDQGYGMAGAHVQIGQVFAGWLQPVLRYAIVTLGDEAADARQLTQQRELTAGLSLYRGDHRFKWQTELSSFRSTRPEPASDLPPSAGAPPGATTTYQLRTQLQLDF
jgi:hypothetical protein